MPIQLGGNTLSADNPMPTHDALIVAGDYIAVTKHNESADSAGPFIGFVMDAEGALKLTTSNGDTRTYATGTFKAGVAYGFGAGIQRVWSTGTGSQNVYGIVGV